MNKITNLHNHKITLTIILALIFALTTAEITSFFNNCKQINNDIFRLHILANSNSTYDQDLKLLVRDKILLLDNDIFSTKNISSENLDLIQTQAESVLLENNCNLPVQVEITNMYFTTRFYENFTLPAGNYDALRITIGEALGDNWWCVLYPPLCLPAVSDNNNNYNNNNNNYNNNVIDILPNEQVDIITNASQYEFKFALFEFYTSIFN